MNTFFSIASMVLGFIFGSFLNVVSLRFNTGKSLDGRSMCFSCKKTLVWYELVPVFSWLIQKGRCRGCSSKIPVELFMSELLTGLFFLLISMRGFLFGNFELTIPYLISTIYLMIVFSILIIILFYDIRHKIIPDKLSIIFGVISFVGMFFFHFLNNIFNFVGFHIPNVADFFSGFIIAAPFAFIWLFSKGRLIGLGDPKLMIGIGFLLGISRGFSAVAISFWIGSLFALLIFILNKIFKNKLLLSGKKGIMKTEIPFAPFLILGTLVVILSGVNVFLIS